MVRVKIKNTKKIKSIITETNNTNTPIVTAQPVSSTQSTNIPTVQGVKPQFSIQEDILKGLVGNITEEFEKNNTLIKIKLTKKFQDIIRFPDAPAMLDALMLAAQFPPKFFNVHKAIAANPQEMIQKSPDFAFKAFTNTEWNITPEYNKDGSNKVNNNYNESYNPVNEDVIGTTAGVVGGVALGAYTMGVASVAFNSDHGVYVTNDSEYKKEYETERTVGALNSPSLVEGIDYYLTNISKNLSVLLRQCTSPNNNKEIEDVLNTISTLSTRANTRIKAYLNDNNETLRKIQEIEQRERENRYRDKATLSTDIKDAVLQCIQDGKTEALKKLQAVNTRQQLEKVMRDYSINESNQYKYSNYINEAYLEGDIIEMDPFDADALYNEVRGNLREKIIKIMTNDPEEWTDVKWARQQMEQMKTDVDKEIKERIKLVCRMADSGQLGLSSKLAAFVSKHPLRVEGLTGIWNRHLRDLDERIQRRIKHISTPESGSPIAMTIEFLQETVPNVIAMMITYKCLAQLLSDSRVQTKYVNAKVEDNDKDLFIKQQINDIPDYLEELFTVYGHNLNKDDKPVYDRQKHDFTGNTMDYLSIFMLKIFNNKINSANVKVFTKIVDDLLSVSNDVDSFFNKFIQILTENNLIDIITNFSIIQIFSSVHNDLNNIHLIFTAAKYIDEHPYLMLENNRTTFNFILSRILASEGSVLKNFKNNREKILQGNITPNTVNDLLKLSEIPEDKIVVWTNYCEHLDQIKDIKDIMSIKDPYVKLLNMYYIYRLNICKNYTDNSISNIFNPEIILMFINMFASTAIQHLTTNQISISELVHLNETYNDIDEFYTALHDYVGINIEDKSKIDYNDLLEYQKGLVPILQSTNLQVGQLVKTLQLNNDDIKLLQGINNISDVGNIIGLKVDTLEKFITSCTKSYLYSITDNDKISKANDIFKLILKAVILKYDKDFKSYDITPYKNFINDGKSIVENIKDITFAKFCTDYHIIYDIMNKPANKNFTSNIQQILSNIETKINQAVIDALYSKYQIKMVNGFNLFGINGILYNIGSANYIDENNYIDIISGITIEKNNTHIQVKDDINIKTILCNFLPIIFKMNTVKQLINAIYNKNGK